MQKLQGVSEKQVAYAEQIRNNMLEAIKDRKEQVKESESRVQKLEKCEEVVLSQTTSQWFFDNRNENYFMLYKKGEWKMFISTITFYCSCGKEIVIDLELEKSNSILEKGQIICPKCNQKVGYIEIGYWSLLEC